MITAGILLYWWGPHNIWLKNCLHILAMIFINLWKCFCNENNDLLRNPKRVKTCYTCQARKYSWGWGCDLYNVETLSCKFWSVWTEIKTAALAQLVLLLRVRRDIQSDFAFFLFVTKVTNQACKWEENYSGTCFIFEETYGRTFCQKDYQLSLWVRRDLQSDLFYFLVVIQLANTWFKKKILLQFLHHFNQDLRCL